MARRSHSPTQPQLTLRPANGGPATVFRLLSRWAGVAAATIVVSVAAAAVGVPSAALFAALAVGIAYALLFGDAHPLKPPARVLTFGQVVIGVALGAQLTSDTLSAVAGAGCRSPSSPSRRC